MPASTEILFSPLPLRNITLPNRLVRAATYEGWGDAHGVPQDGLIGCYTKLARGGVGTLITGFAYTSQTGHAMQPGQCGIDVDEKIAPWQRVTSAVRAASSEMKLILQIAHAGRQTRQEITCKPVVGASTRWCSYFRQHVRALDDAGVQGVVNEFAEAARRAREAGFDGVQVHAAHGYLLHQFLSPWTNTRQDRWGEPALLLLEVIRAIHRCCGDDFPVLVKLSGEEDRRPGIQVEDTIATVRQLEAEGVDAVEISYGTMEYALNIIRGAIPVNVALKVNPLYNGFPDTVKWIWKTFCFPSYRQQMIPFSSCYNLSAAVRVKQATCLPVIAVGGFRTLEEMVDALSTLGVDAVSLCRPLIREPDVPVQIQQGLFTRSRCTNCNLCSVHCDSRQPLRCYQQQEEAS